MAAPRLTLWRCWSRLWPGSLSWQLRRLWPSTPSWSLSPWLGRGGGGGTLTPSSGARRASPPSSRRRSTRCRRGRDTELWLELHITLFAGAGEIHVEHSRKHELSATGEARCGVRVREPDIAIWWKLTLLSISNLQVKDKSLRYYESMSRLRGRFINCGGFRVWGNHSRSDKIKLSLLISIKSCQITTSKQGFGFSLWILF